MEFLIFGALTYLAANKIKYKPHGNLGDGHVAYGQPWRNPVIPELGLNVAVHPQANFMRTDHAGFDGLPLDKMRKTHIHRKLANTARRVERKTSYHTTKSGYSRGHAIFAELGHFNGVAQQHPSIKEGDYGINVKKPYIHPVSQNPGAMNSEHDPYVAESLGNETDFHHGPDF